MPWSQGFVRTSPINHLHLNYALADGAADQYAAVSFLRGSDAGHEMWSRSISRNEYSHSDILSRAERTTNGGGM
jgi:hypothetical protein